MQPFIDFPYVNTAQGIIQVMSSNAPEGRKTAEYWEIWSMAFDHTASMGQLDKRYRWFVGRDRGAPRVYAIDELDAMYRVCRLIVRERHACNA
jgi:hypothetical protein